MRRRIRLAMRLSDTPRDIGLGPAGAGSPDDLLLAGFKAVGEAATPVLLEGGSLSLAMVAWACTPVVASIRRPSAKPRLRRHPAASADPWGVRPPAGPDALLWPFTACAARSPVADLGLRCAHLDPAPRATADPRHAKTQHAGRRRAEC
jgi:hypothetical protein